MGYESALVEVPEFPPLGAGGLGCFNQNLGRPVIRVNVMKLTFVLSVVKTTLLVNMMMPHPCREQVRVPPSVHQR